MDRLTSLPDELVTRILSMLPTRDAAATQVVSKRMSRAFCWITTVDLDDSPAHFIERFSLFESFIDNVLHKLSQSQQPLTRFRLCLGADKTVRACFFDGKHTREQACFPEPARLYAWISYPLAQCGLRELDLCFHVKDPAECKLPSEIFARQSLEVLRLDINVVINGDTDIPVICLPNLKLLHLRSLVFTKDDFVTRLVSNCPALEDLSITCWWLKAGSLIISSNSLRRFVFDIRKYEDEEENSDLVLIDTPNLQYFNRGDQSFSVALFEGPRCGEPNCSTYGPPLYFNYSDNLALNYILHLNDLVEACIYVSLPLRFGTYETSFRKQLSLATALSNVKTFIAAQMGFYYAAKLKDPLPMFLNLRTLKLGALCESLCSAKWDLVLLLIFHRSPLLEELVFVEGITQTIPSCCETHLKRIRIYNCYGHDRELNMIRFLLGNAPILKEFVIYMSKRPYGVRFDAPKFDQFKNTLEEIPRASNSCSIIYFDDEPAFN
ncbi:hypothetical protein RND81_13G042000 [Saponaria officinalis]|uniref:F-box domain-containing protein n=1 Tax=Saponaria officinalis TaxID=3572 RepID=A0AAW1GTZ1_SAPOF